MFKGMYLISIFTYIIYTDTRHTGWVSRSISTIQSSQPVFIDSQLGCYVGSKEELDVNSDDDYIHYKCNRQGRPDYA